MRVGDRVRLRDPTKIKTTAGHPGESYARDHHNRGTILNIATSKEFADGQPTIFYLAELPTVYWLEEWLEPESADLGPYCVACGGWWTHRLQCKAA